MNENRSVSEFIESYIDLNAKHHADLEVVLLGYEECEPGHYFGPIMRPYHLLHFVTEGEGLLRLDGQEFHLQKGDIFFIPEDKIAFYQASQTDP